MSQITVKKQKTKTQDTFSWWIVVICIEFQLLLLDVAEEIEDDHFDMWKKNSLCGRSLLRFPMFTDERTLREECSLISFSNVYRRKNIARRMFAYFVFKCLPTKEHCEKNVRLFRFQMFTDERTLREQCSLISFSNVYRRKNVARTMFAYFVFKCLPTKERCENNVRLFRFQMFTDERTLREECSLISFSATTMLLWKF